MTISGPSSRHTVNVWGWWRRLPVQEQGCIAPDQKDRQLLIEMPDGVTSVIPSLPGLG